MDFQLATKKSVYAIYFPLNINTMPITTHVTSLELSRRLKELKVPQNSHFSWLVASDGERLMTNPVNDTYRYFEQCSAYLASELGELLPEEITVGDKTYRLRIKKTHGTKEWLVKYITPRGKRKGYTTLHMAFEGFQRKSLPEALGLMLADVLENHLISVEELGK